MIAAIKRRFTLPPVLPGYRQPRHPVFQRLRNAIFLTLLVLLGLAYGFLLTIFPLWFYVYLGLPLLVLVALTLWALPDTDRFAERGIERLLFAFLLSMMLWPNYIAIAPPGLPWITINRLITFPLVAIFLLSLATSARLRAELKAVLGHSRWMTGCLVAFIAIQFLTLGFSDYILDSINKLIDMYFQWYAVFFISAWVFSRPGRAERLPVVISVCIVVLVAVAFLEYRQGQVLWRDSLPAIFNRDDPTVQTILQGSSRYATKQYRLQSIFSTALNFAEMLALATPFMIHWMLYAKRVWLRFFAAAYLPVSFYIILATDSRLGVVGFFASFIVYFAIWGGRRWIRTHNDPVGPAVVLAYPFAVAAFVALSFFWQRLSRWMWGGGAQQASDQGRSDQWARAWPELAQWPFGHGIGMAAQKVGGYNEAKDILTIDSYYLTILIDYGVLGFVAYFGLVLGGVVLSVKYALKHDNAEARLFLAFATFLMVFFVIKGVLSQDDSHGLIFLVLGAILGFAWRVAQSEPAVSGVRPGLPALRR